MTKSLQNNKMEKREEVIYSDQNKEYTVSEIYKTAILNGTSWIKLSQGSFSRWK